ncbi:porin [Salmonella enterica subsp. enterica serovar Dublin]|nr:porin [Salmonella enterica subsp. enterica serovar Dublin]
MQKKKLISIAIALTLQSYYIPAIAAENNDDEKECPSNISSLPKEKRAKLSPTCLATPENDNHWGWVAGGVAALVAGVAIGVENNGGGDSNHSYTPPTPDNGGDDNVIPPDDSGDDDVTPPDDSGDDDVTPPYYSGVGDVQPQ